LCPFESSVQEPQFALAPKARTLLLQSPHSLDDRCFADGQFVREWFALYREKDFQPALALFLAAAKQDPNDPRVYAYLAGTYDWLGMSVESRMAADTARRIDPDALAIVQFAFGGP
jgi:Flp pilus assembly protein TadD